MQFQIYLFMFLIYVFSFFAHANTYYFSANVLKRLIYNDIEIPVKFDFDIHPEEEIKRFRVHPIFDKGLVSIFDRDTGLWVGSNSIVSKFPFLEKVMKLKFSGFNEATGILKFELFDIKDGKFYMTPELKIWGPTNVLKYTSLLNHSLVARQTSMALQNAVAKKVGADVLGGHAERKGMLEQFTTFLNDKIREWKLNLSLFGKH